MSGGQSSGTGAMTELDDEAVRKNDILSNRDKANRVPGRSLDGKSIQADEYKDNPANHRPSTHDRPESEPKEIVEELASASAKAETITSTEPSIQVDRPGFDLGGSTGDTHAGTGLGFGSDAKTGRRKWGLPR